MPSASQALRDYLNAHRHDPMSDQEELVRLLAQVWPSLAGASDEAMAGWKLDRMEDVSWEPPLLSFRIERHGGTKQGSTRAGMQTWTVDLDAGTATCKVAGYRQLRPQAPRLQVAPLVAEIVKQVVAGAEDVRLKWSLDRTTVRMIIGEVIPDRGPRQTVADRRRRLGAQLRAGMARAGWTPKAGAPPWTYVRPEGA